MEFDRESIDEARMFYAKDRAEYREEIAFAKRWTWLMLLTPLLVAALVPLKTWIGESLSVLVLCLTTAPGIWTYFQLDRRKARIRRAEDELKGVISVGDKLYRDWRAYWVYLVGAIVPVICFLAVVFAKAQALPWVLAGVWLGVSAVLLWNLRRHVYVD